ncbi:MAG: hypothetical protein A2806_00470 [Candidatus Terrybacteria bacterium RIFCSPHIGHO2_01_FULL_48_17]|uniref:DUF192 domain-containing protein n=1 Tax=Candidatus Terrybacteria bacterium RIFCSPHIGHO2_01_FULL_48_17 TaxID=1802362 RepID=A0A1G2PJW9_9BACT|nr:MAG: hypothetical protein A2806_00470 [Candidatus Terrybacteria bacterium RIFCSPHIGHO2_01_FULL_48_17]OHA53685.1 MAG: hypothetical protein A3A30_00790 [Candidatus Terrybacteria bacterium RIFCSPLOWO2_01_FULL_48_14]
MQKTFSLLAFLGIAALLATAATYMVQRRMVDSPCAQRVVFEKENASFCVEVADSVPKWVRGLVGRAELSKGWGMLFVFLDPEPHTFTMKGMLFPLDIIFLDANAKVVYIAHDLAACPSRQACTTVSSPPAQYVLEVNAGVAEALGIQEGMVAQLPKQ